MRECGPAVCIARPVGSSFLEEGSAALSAPSPLCMSLCGRVAPVALPAARTKSPVNRRDNRRSGCRAWHPPSCERGCSVIANEPPGQVCQVSLDLQHPVTSLSSCMCKQRSSRDKSGRGARED